MPIWMPYKNYQLKPCSQHLVEDLWVPIMMVWLPTGSPESLTLLPGELSESCNTEQKANVIALDKAREWVDLQVIP